MFIRVKEWTVNTGQIISIYHHADGGIEIYFANGKRMDVDSQNAEIFLADLAKGEMPAGGKTRGSAKVST